MKMPIIFLNLLGSLVALTLVSAPVLSEESQGTPESNVAAEPGEAVAEDVSAPAAEVPATEAGAITTAPEPVEEAAPPGDASEWLDSVRKQRKADRDRHDLNVQEARESLHRASPWGEDMEKEREAYREAMRNRAAMQQEAMRARRRWVNPYGEHIKDMHEMRRNAMQAQAQAEREYWDKAWDQQEQWMFPPAPPYGWNNPWYYRGY